MVAPMAQRSANGVPIVQVPSPAADAPSWTRVGVIAALGFIAGVAWPRLAGVRLGPSLPDGASSPAVAMSVSASAPSPAAEAPSVGAPPAVESPAPVATASAESSTQAPADLKPVQVEWEVALVRDAPKTGKVIARLPRGSRLLAGPVKDGWYPVTYGSGNSSQGWLYRGAIGR
jgi:hypothetical protein